MASIFLSETLAGIGDDLVESVKVIAKTATLPEEIRAKALVWAVGAASELAKAGKAKTSNDGAAYDAALREIHLYRKAAEAVATGALMQTIGVVEAEGRKRLSETIDLGVKIGLRVLAAALI